MKKKIAILGSTGSIGSTTLKLIEKKIKSFQVIVLSTNTNVSKVYNQAKKFNVKNVIIHDKKKFKKNTVFFKKKKINLYNNVHDFTLAHKKKIDYTMSSITGLNGLLPTLEIIKLTKVIAIANKESIICGWSLIKKELKKNKTKFVPVDSEHYSIFELINNERISSIKKIYITASGGPFLNSSYKRIMNSKATAAIKHPNWKMGKKISIDSSTLLNKVFELIEAKKLFNIKKNIFEIIIEPSSYVHAIVDYKHGITKFLTHKTSMEIPIYNSLFEIKDKNFSFDKVDISKLNNLEFQKVDFKKFPINDILSVIPEKDSLFETILVTANDTLVELYLKNKIMYYDIYRNLKKILNLNEFLKFKKIKPQNLSQIQELSDKVRLKTQSLSVISGS